MKRTTMFNLSVAIAAIDVGLATICAMNGDAYFLLFMLLAGLMWINALGLKSRIEKEGE